MADEPWQEDWGTGGSTSGAPLKMTVTPNGTAPDADEPWKEKWEAPSTTIPRAFADIPKEIAEEFMRGARKVAKLADNDPTKEGTIGSTLNVGSALLGVPQMAFSPITGAARSLIGHPYADLLHEAGKIIAPEIAAKDDPKELYETGKHAADLAMAGFGSRIPGGGGSLGARPTGITAPPAPPAAPPPPVIAAAERLSEVSPVTVPRAVASDSMVAQRLGQAARNIPVLGDPIPKAVGRMIEDLGTANRVVAEHHGTGTGPNVAARIGQGVEGAAAAETRLAEAAARRSDEALRNAWRTDVEGANTGIAANEARAAQGVRDVVGPDLTPQEMGRTAIDRLRAAEREDFARKEQLFGRAENIKADIRADEVRNVTAHVGQELFDKNINVKDPQLTPYANAMWKVVEELGRLEIPHGPMGGGLPVTAGEAGEVVGVTAKALNQTRKKLNDYYGDAGTPGDRRAARGIIRAYDKWMDSAFERALLSGDPDALPAWRAANRQNREWREKFYNDDNDATKFIEKIVTGEVTPQEFANLLVGSGEAGAKGVGSRMLTHFERVFGEDQEIMRALRGGVLNRLMQNPEGMTPKTGQKIYDDIYRFFNTTGEDVSRRIFPAPMRERIEAYGETVRRGKEDRTLIDDIAKATEPTPTEVPKGPAQELADTVVGRGKSDEALFTTIDNYAKTGSRGDLHTLARLVRQMPQQDRGDLAGAVIRNMGKDGETGFSPDKFATAWASYTPQAKAILFGNAGKVRQSLDDIAAVSQRLKDVTKRFGNPSGTGQNVNLIPVIAGIMFDPTGLAAGGAVSGHVMARFLAQPATAQAAAKWSRAYLAAVTRRSAQTNTALQVASKNLAEAARTLGSNVSSGDFMKLLQAPTGRADEEQNK